MAADIRFEQEGSVMRVIVTGSRDQRDGADARQALYERLARLPNGAIVVTGDAGGVDRLALEYARNSRSRLYWERWPADWMMIGKRAGPIRNQAMANRGADLCLAFPGGRGTADCIRRCEKAGIRVERIEP